MPPEIAAIFTANTAFERTAAGTLRLLDVPTSLRSLAVAQRET